MMAAGIPSCFSFEKSLAGRVEEGLRDPSSVFLYVNRLVYASTRAGASFSLFPNRVMCVCLFLAGTTPDIVAYTPILLICVAGSLLAWILVRAGQKHPNDLLQSNSSKFNQPSSSRARGEDGIDVCMSDSFGNATTTRLPRPQAEDKSCSSSSRLDVSSSSSTSASSRSKPHGGGLHRRPMTRSQRHDSSSTLASSSAPSSTLVSSMQALLLGEASTMPVHPPGACSSYADGGSSTSRPDSLQAAATTPPDDDLATSPTHTSTRPDQQMQDQQDVQQQPDQEQQQQQLYKGFSPQPAQQQVLVPTWVPPPTTTTTSSSGRPCGDAVAAAFPLNPRPLQAVSAPLVGFSTASSTNSQDQLPSVQSLSDPSGSISRVTANTTPHPTSTNTARLLLPPQGLQGPGAAAALVHEGTAEQPNHPGSATCLHQQAGQIGPGAHALSQPTASLDLAALLSAPRGTAAPHAATVSSSSKASPDTALAAAQAPAPTAAVEAAGPSVAAVASRPPAQGQVPQVRPIGLCLPAPPWSQAGTAAAAGGPAAAHALYTAAAARPASSATSSPSALYKSPLQHVTISVKVCGARSSYDCTGCVPVCADSHNKERRACRPPRPLLCTPHSQMIARPWQTNVNSVLLFPGAGTLHAGGSL